MVKIRKTTIDDTRAMKFWLAQKMKRICCLQSEFSRDKVELRKPDGNKTRLMNTKNCLAYSPENIPSF